MLGSDESSSDEDRSKEKRKRRMVPVMQPCLKVKTKNKGIIINLSMTKYEVIADVAEELDWTLQYSSKKGDWDVLWTDHMIEPDTLIKMHFFQKISHFPGIHVLARKNLLGMSFMEMRQKFPQQYAFFPKTWLLPNDYPQFRQQVQKNNEQNTNQCYIVKPEADCQGRGIFLTFKTDEVENGKHYVVQQYIQQPFLVDGLKFDFRVYVLLCGTNPMRLYFYEQGLARFATEKYVPPAKNNLKKTFMHLTNYAINKKNPKYVYNSSSKNMSTGHKRSMTSVFKNIERRGFNLQSLKQKIYDVLVKTVILGQPLVSHQYKFAQPDDQYRNMCFHILGIDIMIDELLNPIVLQVNHTPSFATDTPLDYQIKSKLIKDTLILMNINEETKKQMVNKTNSYQRERITNAKRLVETEEKRALIKEAQLKRDEYESQNRGRYTKIYPVEDPIKMEEYEEYMKYAEKIQFSQNNIIRTQIQLEKQKQKLGGSKKNLSKKSPVDSPIKSAIRPTHSYSERQIDEKLKNSSTQLFASESKISSLLSHPFSGLINSSIGSIGFNVSGNMKNGHQISPKRGYPRISKSINQSQQLEENPMPCNRVSLIKNLPKIEQISPMKSSTIQINKSKYTSLRRKKLIQEKRLQPNKNLGQKKNNPMMGVGSFLTPKVMRFQNYQEQQLIQSPVLNGKVKQSMRFHLGNHGSSVGF